MKSVFMYVSFGDCIVSTKNMKGVAFASSQGRTRKTRSLDSAREPVVHSGTGRSPGNRSFTWGPENTSGTGKHFGHRKTLRFPSGAEETTRDIMQYFHPVSERSRGNR
ncbi:MAG: hypothetical protein IT279_00270 [Ignavibacteriaceae bacterium]|nr:hypothetical protein [Ignavibacteriaceae bacterium]